MNSEFHAFGPDHQIVLILIFLFNLAVVLSSKRIRRFNDDFLFRRVSAAALMCVAMTSWIYLKLEGVKALPLHLCDLALFLTAYALISAHPIAGELAFFWTLAGSTQAVLTPDLFQGFPSFAWFSFFLSHGGAILGGIYLLARGFLKLSVRSVWRVFFASNLYVLAMGLVNFTFGTNFGYLASKPDHPSLLDYLGPWPIYIFALEVLALGLFFACYGFGRWVDRFSRD